MTWFARHVEIDSRLFIFGRKPWEALEMRVYEDSIIEDLELILCKMKSLGTILTHLSTMECQDPDMTSLADLGRIIQEQTTTGLEVIEDGKEITDPFLKFDIDTSCKKSEIPKATKVLGTPREIGFVRARKKSGEN